MSTTYAITDFSHGTYAYTNDSGVANNVSMRNVYATVSGLTAGGGGTPNILSKHARRRYIHSPTGGVSGATSQPLERHFPIATSKIATPGTIGTLDGVTDWVVKGYRGEQQRA
jgi:hypothetical protein